MDHTTRGQDMCNVYDQKDRSSVSLKDNHVGTNPPSCRTQDVQDVRGDSTKRGHTTTYHHMHEGGHEQIDEDDRVSEAIILVGDIPCPMVGPARSKRPHEEGTSRQMAQSNSPGHDEHKGKKVWLMSNAGHEIVGPGYSEVPVDKKVAQHSERASWQVVRGAREHVQSDLVRIPS
jgi:hypothetical protein